MTLEEAKKLLSQCTRNELRDHAFGDCEISWTKDLEEIAGGYFSGKVQEVYFNHDKKAVFKGSEAYELRNYGDLKVERNDETGPDTFVVGKCMPGLTLEGVFKELTGK